MEIRDLPILQKLGFSDPDFPACPIAKLPGYREFILSTVASQYLQILDGEILQSDARESANRDYVREALRLQERLSGIEHEHRSILMQLDSKNRENDDHLKYIQRMLIEDLHSLKDSIEQGKDKLLKEQQRLTSLHLKSEETLKQELKVLQSKFNKEIDRASKKQNDIIDVRFNQRENVLYEENLKALEVEKDVAITLIDVLYSSEGQIIYNELTSQHHEYQFVQLRLQLKSDSVIRKVYQVAQADQAANSNSIQFYYTMIQPTQLKEFLTNKLIAQRFQFSITANKSFPNSLGTYILLMCRVNLTNEPEDDKITLSPTELQNLICDYVIIVQNSLGNNAKTSVDDMLLDFLQDSSVIYTQESTELLDTFEREAMEKYNDHLKRLWGELDSSTSELVREQDEEISSLLALTDSLRAQIDAERGTQLQLLKQLRANAREEPRKMRM